LCLYSDKGLALALDVRDDRVVRVGKGKAEEDRLVVELIPGAPLHLFPGAAGASPRRRLGTAALPRWLAVEDSLAPRGFVVELVVPWRAFPGSSAGSDRLPVQITFHDSDQATGKGSDAVTVGGALELSGRAALVRDFLQAVGQKLRDVTVDVVAEVDVDQRGPERVIAAGKAIGVLTSHFGFVTLPVASGGDVRSVQMIDWRGRGSQFVAAVVRQFGGGGSRDLLLLYRITAAQFEPVLTVEVRKELKGNVLESEWKLVPTRRKGVELVVTARPAVGFDPASYHEELAPDASPIHLPWDPARVGTAYWLEGDAVRSRDLKKSP
jgi:hypothetical protein